MKFNQHQESAILSYLEKAVPTINPGELWYGYVQPFLNEKDHMPGDKLVLAETTAEFDEQMEFLARDYILRYILANVNSPQKQAIILTQVSETLIAEVAQIMKAAVFATVRAIKETPLFSFV